MSPDGNGFLMIKRAERSEDAAMRSIVIVLNWFEELERLVPVR